MHLKQRRQAQLLRQDQQINQLRIAQALGNQQDRISARRRRLPHLVRINDEVLAQHRQRHAILDPPDEREVAPEEVSIRQARDRGGPALVVLFRDELRRKTFARILRPDQPGRGAHALHLRDHRRPPRRIRPRHRRKEVARSLPHPHDLLQPMLRSPRLGLLNLNELAIDDARKRRGRAAGCRTRLVG